MDIDTPTKEQLHKIYGIYLNDFVVSGLYFEGKKVIVNNDIVRNKREGYFLNKQKSFDHIVTRENKGSVAKTGGYLSMSDVMLTIIHSANR